MKRPIFINNQIYHIYNRGVEKREIFGNDDDRFRFIHDLFEFNDCNPAFHTTYYFNKRKIVEVEPLQFKKKAQKSPRKLLVEIMAFCLMPNHYHLLIRQLADNGIVNFMKKIGTGYTLYFNTKYKRVGSLFQGRFKANLIDQESQFIHIPHYIHLNPLKIVEPYWKEGVISDYEKNIQFIENYRWSSFLDYIGKKNFPSVTQREFLLNFFNGQQNYKKETCNWLKERKIVEVEPLQF